MKMNSEMIMIVTSKVFAMVLNDGEDKSNMTPVMTMMMMTDLIALTRGLCEY